jgi:DNA-binding PadR family transcriptional regulator
MLGDLEQLVLLAVLRVAPDAYGVSIATEVEQRAGRALTLATIHKTLVRLEDKGMLLSELGAPTPVRGGKAKRFYRITPAGRRAVRTSIAGIRRMAAGLDLGLEKL